MLDVKKAKKKRIIAAIIISLIVVIMFSVLGTVIFIRLDWVDYKTTLQMYADNEITAEYNGIKTQVAPYNKDYLYGVLNITERSRLWSEPEIPDGTETINITYGDNTLKVTVFSIDSIEDIVYVRQQRGTLDRWVSIEGYNVFERATWCVRPQGYYQENIVLE